jgi:hypothetical protein
MQRNMNNTMQRTAHKHISFCTAVHMYVSFEALLHVCSAARSQLLITNCNVATEGCSPEERSMLMHTVHVLLSS